MAPADYGKLIDISSNSAGSYIKRGNAYPFLRRSEDASGRF
jgi:hypothetical protein